jgi:ParB family chromosome partitioning protein
MNRRSNLDSVFSTRPSAAANIEAAEASDADLGSKSRLPLGAPNKAANKSGSNPYNTAPLSRLRSGAIAAMGGALEHLATRAQMADQLENGTAVLDLDPALIDRSFVADRLDDETDPTLATLVKSIQDSGQHVPILVRPNPNKEGRYQIAYGHRRARAAIILGKPVRAVVRTLTDAELVVAQGKENLERRDLSFIERAFFALHLEQLKFSRETISAAMSADKADVSRYVTVARALPYPVVTAIGPAPKAGRPRWQMLIERLHQAGAEKVSDLIADAQFRAKPTDERFVAVLAALNPRADEKIARKSNPSVWTDPEGRKLAHVARANHRFNLSIDESLEPDFGDYLLTRLPEILTAFKARQG